MIRASILVHFVWKLGTFPQEAAEIVNFRSEHLYLVEERSGAVTTESWHGIK